MSGLKQTIYANSGRVENLNSVAGPYTEIVAASAADLKDGSDLTFDKLNHADDGFQGPFGFATYLWTMDPVTYSGPISKVVVNIRYCADGGATWAPSFMLPIFNGFFPAIQALNILDSFPTFGTVPFSLTKNPQTGLDWKLADINAGQFGWRIDDEGEPAPVNFNTYVSEFSVEIWGMPPQRTLVGQGQ